MTILWKSCCCRWSILYLVLFLGFNVLSFQPFSPQLKRKICCQLQFRKDILSKATMDTVIQETYNVVDLTIFDFYNICRLSANEFFPSMPTFKDKVQLLFKIVELMLPKLLLPGIYRHSMIGAKTESGDLMGFVDISLQSSSGSSEEALSCVSLRERSSKYQNLRPYICNVLIASPYRKRGVALRLLRECEARTMLWGHSEVYLHADMTELPVMKLYLKAKFEPVKSEDSLVFMRKVTRRSDDAA